MDLGQGYPGGLGFNAGTHKERHGMDMAFMEILREFGVMVALVVFFTWQGWKRETRLNDRISALEEDYTSTLKELVTDCTEVISANTSVMKRLERQFGTSSDHLEK